MRYIEKTALGWAEEGIRTVKEALFEPVLGVRLLFCHRDIRRFLDCRFWHRFRSRRRKFIDVVSVSSIADRFNYTEKDIFRALLYWDRHNLISLEFDESNTYWNSDFL